MVEVCDIVFIWQRFCRCLVCNVKVIGIFCFSSIVQFIDIYAVWLYPWRPSSTAASTVCWQRASSAAAQASFFLLSFVLCLSIIVVGISNGVLSSVRVVVYL